MKQVTMDFDTYVEELKAAKHLGFNIVPELKDRLLKIVKAVESRQGDAFDKAIHEIHVLLRELDQVGKAQV